jgi:hypothetical protein
MPDTSLFVNRRAEFSPDRRYRYSLTILWDSGPMAAFIGLNPSTADEVQDDPTIRRCRGFASEWGCGGMVMLNLFAFRATDPKVMKLEPDPIGKDNTIEFLDGVLSRCDGPRIACWGRGGSHLGRSAFVLQELKGLSYLRMSKGGEPWHPLYLPKGLKPYPFKEA